MSEAVLVAHARTPLAKSFRGAFNMTRPEDLAAHCIREVLRKAPGVDPAEVADVYMGCGRPYGQQGHNIARVSALLAGLPVTVPAATISRFCASGLQAVAMAAHAILQEGASVAIGGGVESITALAGTTTEPHPRMAKEKPGLYMVMGDTAEVVAKRYGVSREAQDEYALSSQQRCAHGQAEGFFDEEISPMDVTYGVIDKATKQIGETRQTRIEKDECNRPDTTLEGLAQLKPYFDPDSGQGTVTAGNASQLSDGASACLMMSRDRAEALGLEPKVVFRGMVAAGCEPDEMGIAPVFAVPKLLQRFNLTVDDIDVWELNEAFAVQVVYCRDRLAIDQAKLNVNGGSVAIGHPFGMTGSRLVGTIANQMIRSDARYGVVTMCVSGGQAGAALFERWC
jgi:acetyl-CoA acetyltransferase family protein